MTRDEWCAAFVAELTRLRPYLEPAWGKSRIALAIAMNAHDEKLQPEVAARRWHAHNPAAKG